MIAIIGGGSVQGGPIPMALVLAGFEACEVESADDAKRRLRRYGPGECMLVLDARSLERERESWADLLEDSRAAAVVLAYGEADPTARTLTEAPHRILVENPFDAAAVVAAAIRACATARNRAHRVSITASPGSKYAS